MDIRHECNVLHRLSGTIRKRIVHILILVFIGCISIVGLEVLSQSKAGEVIVNKVYDEFIKGYAVDSISHLNKSDTARKNSNVVYIDIDDYTYNSWGSPLITPRDKLSQILKQTYAHGAKVVILDIDIDSSSNVADDDTLLKNTIKDLSSKYTDTYLILPKRIKDHRPFKGIVDEIVNSRNNIFFAVPSFYLSSTDNVARFWSPYKVYDNKVFWHTSMLAFILLENNFTGLKQSLEENSLHRDHRVKHLVDKYKSNVNHRIYFNDIPANTISAFNSGNMFMNRVTYMDIDRSDLTNKIVIIGNSSADFGDIHSTPVGTMPGMYIIGNIVNTISGVKSTGSSSDWWLLLIDFFIIVATSVIITLIDKNWLQFIFYVFWSLILIWICSVVFVSYNVLIVAPIGVLTICAYEGISDVENWLSGFYKKLRPGGTL